MKKEKIKEQKYKAIIFDLDGTLINSLPYHFLAFKDLLLEHDIRIDNRHLKKLMGMPTTDILKELKNKYKFKENVQDLREERRYHYFKFLGMRNIVFKGITATLKKLRFNYKIAVATGSSKVVFAHSTDKDFQDVFDFVATINDVNKGKPYPEQFLYTARNLHVKPNDCVVVGDSIYDAIAAKHAAMDFIGVTTGYNKKQILAEYGAVKVLKSVNELTKFW
jgi:HAD superfamily hydrolase (TIGR01509 family)